MDKFLKDESGTVAVGFGVIISVLLVSTGAAIDINRTVSKKQSLQTALDNATLHAALNVREQNYKENAQFLFETNFDNREVSNLTSDYNIESQFVKGTASGEVDLTFGRLLGRDSVSISATSQVSFGGAPACIIALETINGAGITLNSGANITSSECGIEVHSKRNPAFIINSGVTLGVPRTCIAGDRIIDNNRTVDNIQLECPVNPDPYLGAFPVPSSANCDYRNMNFNQAEVTLEPGVYCGGVNFNNSNAKVHFTGGDQPYVIRGGNWNVNGGDWTGDNVTFYYADRSQIQFNSGVKATLTPPTSGPYAGVFMTEAPNLGDSRFTLNDSRGFDFEGIIYLPSREVTMNSGSTIRSRELRFVARKFIFNGISLNLETPASTESEESLAYISQ